MNTTFGKIWFRAKKRLTEVWDEDRARKCHEERKPYVAVLGPLSAPSCFLEINDDYIGIGFLDGNQREYLSYQYQELELGRLFLSMATHREFDGDSDEVSNGTTFHFSRTGNLAVVHEDFRAGTISRKETQTDVGTNWESYPQFLKYESIIRTDR